MRVGHLQPTRPEWYDRNPATLILTVNVQIIGADGGTTRSSLTIPTGKKAYLDLSTLIMTRLAEGTPDNRVNGILLYNNGGGGVTIQRVDSSVSSYGPIGDQWLGQGGIMLPGESLSWVTSSTFPDGTIAVIGNAKITTFDA